MSDKKRILVVDDEMAVVMMMVFLLTRAGFEVEAARNAEQALRKAHADTFDLICLDIGMPGTNGFELYRLLKQLPRLKETSVIFVSDCGTTENRQRASELGAAGFIEKPFGAFDFISRILSQVEETALT